MYLKSLELQGFKSFPDKTKLTFERGATVIVGPNGSGKSNISDAMRWVLGELSSKNLRGSKMEDIIFGGADSRKPMGYAEVCVTFDNTDEEGKLDCPYDEVSVTRRYYRAGESEYFINRQPVRLKDIYELFMNTGIGRDGYSIIGQGKIAEIISRKSDERRSIFEDASGIAKYRHRKSEAERKLASTEDNMLRINDILSELEGRVGPLEKESAKARKYLDLYETKKKADVQLWLFDTERLRGEVQEAETACRLSSIELQNVDDTITSLELQNDKLFEASQSNKLESEQLLDQIRAQTAENHDYDSDFKVGESNILHIEEMIKTAEQSIEAAKQSIEASNGEIEAKKAHITALEGEIEEIKRLQGGKTAEQTKCTDEEKALEEKIAQALNDLRVLEAERTDVRVRISVIENAKNTESGSSDSISEEIENYKKTSADLAKKYANAKDGADKYRAEIDRYKAESDSAEAKLGELQAKRAGDTAKLNHLSATCDSLFQRIEALRRMEEHFEGYSNSVRFVMKQYGEGKITNRTGSACGTIYGPLSKLISVDSQYITAIETALGANLQNIVVENEETAKNAMFALKSANAGRATFYPLTSMKASTQSGEVQGASKFKGYVGTADSLIKCDGKFKNVISSVLGRTVIFDNIDNASAMAKAQGYKVRTVTLDGQQINQGGSFTGGSAKRDSGMLSRSGEIEKLKNELASAEKERNQLDVVLSQLESKISDAENTVFDMSEKIKLMSTMMNAETVNCDRISAQLEANNALIEKLRRDFEALDEMSRRYDEDIAALTAKEKELDTQISEISEYRSDREVERNALSDRKTALGEELIDLYIKISDTQKDIETERTLLSGISERIASVNEGITATLEKIEEHKKTRKVYEAQQSENREKAKTGDDKLAQLNALRREREEGGFEFERRLNEIRAKIRDKMSEKELIFRNHTANETKLERIREESEKLSSHLWDEYELTRAAAVELEYPALTKEERPAAVQTQTECRNKLRALGSVNVGAIEEYAEVKTRYDYMTGQIKDLNDAKNELTKIINQLEGEMKTSFIESFNAINENFNKTFSELFGGGTAELQLTDPEDVLTSGIEIKAAPPGKIIKSQMQLSGGEQSFVAIALFFAILKVNPTAFCILDEIEAALDEVNVSRFGEYIKRYCGETQFILITHRRGTMEVADRLYGVTMPEHGISKVLSLNVADISKTEGDDWDGIFRQA